MKNKLIKIKKLGVEFWKKTYVKFMITYSFSLFGFYILFSPDFLYLFKTVSLLSILFYGLFFSYYCAENIKENKENVKNFSKNEKKYKKSLINKIFKRSNDDDIMNKLHQEVMEHQKVTSKRS